MLNLKLLIQLRQQNPLVHNITNIVVANYVANGLLAIGASPIMANAVEEMDELAKICDGVAINIGTLTPPQVEAMLTSGQAANRYQTPLLLDPVGVGATTYRRMTIDNLLNTLQFSAIRGNLGEMATLAGIDWRSKGVDSGQGEGNIHQIAQSVAQKYQTVAVISGAIDIVSDGKHIIEINNGTPLFSKITGSGCLHGAICTAFIALNPQEIFSACVTACVTYAIAGEIAVQDGMHNGTFTTALLDALATITPEQVAQRANIKEIL